MRILLISPEDMKGTNWGGVSTYTTILAEELGRMGHQITVLIPGDANETLHTTYYQCFRLHHNERLDAKVVKIIRKLFGIWFFESMKRIRWSIDVLSFVRTHGPFDIVEAPEWGNSTLFLSLFSRQKTVVKLHRGWYAYMKDNKLPMNVDVWLACIFEFVSIIVATGISSPTKYMLVLYRRYIDIYRWFKKSMIQIIPYGINMSAYKKQRSPSMKNPYILYIGRIEIAKGAMVLVEAFHRLLKTYTNVKLLIIGEDIRMNAQGSLQSYKAMLQSYIQEHGFENKVKFLGKQNRNVLSGYYNDCLFVVVPSVNRENYPYVVLEAFVHKKAVIASRAGGLPEMIKHGVNGLLCNQNDPEELSRALQFLLSHTDSRREYEKYNTVHIHEHDIHIIAKKTLSFYRKVIAL